MDPRIEKAFNLPLKQKVIILVVILVLEGVAFFLGVYRPRSEEYRHLKGKLEGLKGQIAENRKIADNLPRFKQEYEQLNKELQNALTELPNQKEIPTLLTSITSVGKAAGLDFLLFRPRGEEPKEFYASVPVDISVYGTFFNVANFFVSVANLPRIVNISNVSFAEIRDVGGRNMVKVNCLATTFRFLDKKETKNETKSK